MNVRRATVLAAMLALAGLAPLPAWADDGSPVGLWKNIDDVTGKPKALIRISAHNGVLQGRIEQLFPAAGQDANPVCVHCRDARRNQPVVGMVFMTGLTPDGDGWGGGEILDPDNGKVYRSRITLADGGKQLHVRGYIGVPMLGRSQTWIRQP